MADIKIDGFCEEPRGPRGHRGHRGHRGPTGPTGTTIAGPASQCLIFQPGSGASGPGVFDSWTDMMAALDALRAANNGEGCFEVMIDSQLAPAVVPPGGPYNFSNVLLRGNGLIPQLGPAINRLDVADGATFIGLRNIVSLRLVNFNNVTPMDSTLGAPPLTGDIIRVSIGAVLENNGLAPMWRVFPGGVGALANLISEIIGTIGAVVDLPTPGTFFALGLGAGARVAGSAWSGVVGSVIQIGRQSSGATFASVYPAFLGTLSVSAGGWTAVSELRPRPFGGSPITSATNLEYGDYARCDASGGAFAVTLPPLSTATQSDNFNPGSMNVVAELSGSVGLSIIPSGGDTINGLVAPFPVASGGTVTLINDGFSDWRVIATTP